MSGDTEHLWFHVVHGELPRRDRVHFVLQREANAVGGGRYWLLGSFCGNGSLTSRKEVVDVCMRTSVL